MRLSTPSQPSTCAPSSLPRPGRTAPQEQRRGARIVGGMAVLVGVDLAIVQAGRAQLGLGPAGVPAVISNTLTTAVPWVPR